MTFPLHGDNFRQITHNDEAFGAARLLLIDWRKHEPEAVDAALEVLECSRFPKDIAIVAEVNDGRVKQLVDGFKPDDLEWAIPGTPRKADRLPKLAAAEPFGWIRPSNRPVPPPICWRCAASWAALLAIATLAVIGAGTVIGWL